MLAGQSVWRTLVQMPRENPFPYERVRGDLIGRWRERVCESKMRKMQILRTLCQWPCLFQVGSSTLPWSGLGSTGILSDTAMIAWSLSTNDIPVSYGFEPQRSKGDATRAAQKFEDYLIGLAAWTDQYHDSWACATPDLWYRYHIFWYSRMNLIISRRKESWGDQAAEAARQVRQVYNQKHLSAKFADWFTRQGKVW